MSKLLLINVDDYDDFKDKMVLEGKKLLPISKAFNFSTNNLTDEIEDYYEEEVLIDLRSFKESNNMLFLERIVNNELSGSTFFADFVDKYMLDQLDTIFEDIQYFKTEKAPSKVKENEIIKKITDLNRNEIEQLTNNFSQSILGHDRFKESMGEKLLEYKILNSIGESDIFSIFLMGMSGIGKTEVARTLHSLLGGKKQLTKINFGNYSSQESLNSLIGSPRGYIGSETGELFEKIQNSDTGIILIDEFEKADGKVFNYFLEVLETGFATNSQGVSLNLNGYVFVFTSNVPEEKFEHVFSPELRSRFNLVSLFKPLNTRDKEIYIYTRLKKYVDKFNTIHNKNLNKKSIDNITKSINVHNYHNLRLLNNQIRKEFIKYIKGSYSPDDEMWLK